MQTSELTLNFIRIDPHGRLVQELTPVKEGRVTYTQVSHLDLIEKFPLRLGV